MRLVRPTALTRSAAAILVPALALAFVPLAACKKKATPPEPPAEVTEAPVEAAPEAPTTEDEAIAIIEQNFQRVHFDTDSTDLVGSSEQALEANAKLLQEFAGVRVEVQGHADERGTTDYNLALGQRRANIIKDRLERMGVSAGRVTLVSFGEERPIAQGSGESVWSENRRAEFRVLRSPPGVPVTGTVE